VTNSKGNENENEGFRSTACLIEGMSLLTSHFRSNVDVFVYAFLARRMSASFLAACRMGSESGEEF